MKIDFPRSLNRGELLGRRMELQLMRIASQVLSVICLALVTLTTASLHAVPLQTDPNGMDGGVPALWQGSKAYLQAAPVGTGSLNALVDFAVFAPAKFNLSYPGMDPSGGANYVYAYTSYITWTLAPLRSAPSRSACRVAMRARLESASYPLEVCPRARLRSFPLALHLPRRVIRIRARCWRRVRRVRF